MKKFEAIYELTFTRTIVVGVEDDADEAVVRDAAIKAFNDTEDDESFLVSDIDRICIKEVDPATPEGDPLEARVEEVNS